MKFEKENFNFANFNGKVFTDFGFRENILKNKKAKKHIKKLLDIIEDEADKELEKRYDKLKKNVKKRINRIRNIVVD